MRLHFAFALLFAAFAVPAFAQSANPATLHMRAMTWMEVKAAVDAGFTRVIVPSGGIEQNGPHMVLAKHDFIVTYAAEHIARNVGQMLVAPTLSIVPEGDFSPPTGNMKWPGTIGISERAYELLLDGVARSLKQAGFKEIFFIGDHGQAQASQQRVAEYLTRQWRSNGVRVHQIIEYYDDAAQIKMLQGKGESPATIGEHAGLIDTSELLSIAPDGVRLQALQNLQRPLAELGASGTPEKSDATLGKQLIEMRIGAATTKIRSLFGQR